MILYDSVRISVFLYLLLFFISLLSPFLSPFPPPLYLSPVSLSSSLFLCIWFTIIRSKFLYFSLFLSFLSLTTFLSPFHPSLSPQLVSLPLSPTLFSLSLSLSYSLSLLRNEFHKLYCKTTIGTNPNDMRDPGGRKFPPGTIVIKLFSSPPLPRESKLERLSAANIFSLV
jgi:hypothetical protein